MTTAKKILDTTFFMMDTWTKSDNLTSQRNAALVTASYWLVMGKPATAVEYNAWSNGLAASYKRLSGAGEMPTLDSVRAQDVDLPFDAHVLDMLHKTIKDRLDDRDDQFAQTMIMFAWVLFDMSIGEIKTEVRCYRERVAA